MAERRREQPPSGALVAFNKATTYGPMFGCLVCQTHHFREGVVEAEGVRGLATRECRERFLDLPYIHSNPSLFTQLDRQWVCRSCRDSVDRGEMPALAAKNGLRCTWASLPPALLNLSHEELDLLGLTHFCLSIQGLTHGVVAVGRPSKNLLLPLSEVRDVRGLADCSRPPEELQAMHCRPQGHLARVRAGPVVEAWEMLLEHHSLYRTINPLGREVALDFMVETVGGMQVAQELMEGGDNQVNFFNKAGFHMKELLSIVLQTKRPIIPAGEKKMLRISNLTDKLYGIFDIQMEAGPGVTREVPITQVQWQQHILSNVQRSGPANCASFLLSSLLRYETERLTNIMEWAQTSGGSMGSHHLMSHQGSDAYYSKIGKDLETLHKWRGPAAYNLTLSMSVGTADLLGTRVSHQAGVEGREEQVWHSTTEQEHLTLRPGKELPPSGFFVHTRTSVKSDSCPYHCFCSRTPLDDRKAR